MDYRGTITSSQIALAVLIVVLAGFLLFTQNLVLGIITFFVMAMVVAALLRQVLRRSPNIMQTADLTSKGEGTAIGAQKRFISRVSHELRTPLTIIKGENQVLLARRRSIEEYEQQILSNLEEVEKMERVIDDLLMFSKYESGETDMPMRWVALEEIVANSVKDLSRNADEKGLDIISELQHAEILCDPSSMERLVCKLIENAIQYSRPGGKVSVRTKDQGDRVLLEVEDEGIGIPEAELTHVFDRFFRGSNAKAMRQRGTGVGLSLAKTIAELHHADISVQSELNVGTKFIVTFARQRE